MSNYTDALPRSLEYRPAGMCMWDTWCVVRDGQVHLFHLQMLAHESTRPKEHADFLGHAVSSDLLEWRELPLALGPNAPGTRDDLQPWTGCCYEHGGTYYLYYTMRSSLDKGHGQHIGLATSSDLVTWTRHPDNPVISPDPRWYVSHQHPLPPGAVDEKDRPGIPGLVDARDLIVQPHPDGGWIGFYAARIPSDECPEGAVIACVRSHDLVRWTHLPPAFAPGKYNCLEVPDVFCLDGRWYLTCLSGYHYGNRGYWSDPHISAGTLYAVADRPEGPYREFDGDNVLIGGDGTCGYSCRTVAFEGQRHLLFTQPTGHYLATVSPPFGLRTTADGRLRATYSPRTQAWRERTLAAPGAPPPIALLPLGHGNWNVPGGRWSLDDGTYRGESRTAWQIADLLLVAPNLEVEANVTVESGAAAGLAIRATPGHLGTWGDMILALDAERQCVLAAGVPAFTDAWRRSFPVRRGHAYRLRVCARGHRFEVFVDDDLVLQFHTAKALGPLPGPRSVALFVDRAEARIDSLAAYALRSLA